MTGLCRPPLRTVTAYHLEEGRRGSPERVRIPGLREFRKSVLVFEVA